MRKRRILYICLVLLLTATLLSGCSSQLKKTTAGYPETIPETRCPTGVVAENDRWQMLWDDSRQCLILYERATGNVYATTPYDFYASGVTEGLGVVEMMSPIVVHYLDSNTQTVRSVGAQVGSITENGVSSQAIDGGVKVDYAFPRQRIGVSVEFLLAEDGVEIRVPMADIKEDENLVYKISVTPYFAAAKHEDGNYLFVPSGGGALIDAKDRNTKVTYSEMVYGEDLTTPLTMKKHYQDQVLLPVFGVKNGASGMLGVVENGAEAAWIETAAGDAEIGYSGVYASFQIRGGEELVYSSLGNHDAVAVKYSNAIVDEEYVSVRYLPLSEDATYIGMAACYRNYLQSKGYLQTGVTEVPALSVDLLGGTEIKDSLFGIPYMREVSTTTLAQAQTIAQDMQTLVGEGQLLLTLTGFGESGLASRTVGGGFTLSSGSGGQKAWQQLRSFAEQNNAVLALDYDLVRLQSGGAGYGTWNDVVKGVGGLSVKKRTYHYATQVENESGPVWYLLSRLQLPSAINKATAHVKQLGGTAVSLSALGYSAYSDYRDPHYVMKGHMAEEVSALLQECSQQLTVVTERPNVYAALHSTHITEVPLSSSRIDGIDRDIPFYSFVFQGYKSLTSPSVNTAINVEKTYLSAVATGMTLQFTLFDTEYPELRYDANTAYLTSKYSEWREEIAEMVQRSCELHALTGTQAIADYRMTDGVSYTLFENGVEVYVNYTDQQVTTPLGIVEPCDFVYQS